MKTTCDYLNCKQKIEYDKSMSGQVIPCPVCNRPTTLPKAPLQVSLPKFTGFGKFWSALIDVYFDRKAVAPDKESPYYFIIALVYALYCIAVVILLASVLIFSIFATLGILTAAYFEIRQAHGFSAIIQALLKTCGSPLVSYISIIIGTFFFWAAIHISYKVTRVIFDIAEYTRLTVPKQSV